jgi:hypothetical protein
VFSLLQSRLYFLLFHHLFRVPSYHLCLFPFLHRLFLVRGSRLVL